MQFAGTCPANNACMGSLHRLLVAPRKFRPKPSLRASPWRQCCAARIAPSVHGIAPRKGLGYPLLRLLCGQHAPPSATNSPQGLRPTEALCPPLALARGTGCGRRGGGGKRRGEGGAGRRHVLYFFSRADEEHTMRPHWAVAACWGGRHFRLGRGVPGLCLDFPGYPDSPGDTSARQLSEAATQPGDPSDTWATQANQIRKS